MRARLLLTAAATLLVSGGPALSGEEEREKPRRPDKLAISVDYESFDETFSPWRMLSVQYTRRMSRASLVGRVNAAHRFDKDGVQYEVDLYPKLPRNGYVYLNAGFSRDDSVFPEYRLGAEVYRSFPAKLEGSLGFRRLAFTSTKVMLYTGSLAKYHGSYWISLRPYYVSKDSGSSASLGLSLRRYYSTADEHVTLSAGYGQRDNEVILSSEVTELTSWKVRIEGQKPASRDLILKGEVAVQDREFRPGRARRSWSLGGGLEWLF